MLASLLLTTRSVFYPRWRLDRTRNTNSRTLRRLPMPLSLRPPKGTSGVRAPWLLIHTVPAWSWLATCGGMNAQARSRFEGTPLRRRRWCLRHRKGLSEPTAPHQNADNKKEHAPGLNTGESPQLSYSLRMSVLLYCHLLFDLCLLLCVQMLLMLLLVLLSLLAVALLLLLRLRLLLQILPRRRLRI